jgi:hypothetical protein
MPSPDSPDWLREAALRTWDEARLFAQTALRFTTRPGRFARDWASGALSALNPLAMLATAAGLLGTANNLLGRLISKGSGGDSLVLDVLAAGAPFVHYALLGLGCHLVLRLLGSQRHVRDSVAMALFAGAGPAALAHLLIDAFGALLYVQAGRPPLVRGGLFATLHGPLRDLLVHFSSAGFVTFLVTFGLALGALHQRKAVAIVLALAVTLAAVGVLFGLLPPLPFGTRLIIWLRPFNVAVWVD